VRRLLAAFAALLFLGLASPSLSAGADPADQLADPAAEARARHLFKELRCLMCQNESIDDSHAPIAADLRKVVREQVAAGKSDAEIKSFLVARYGDFVLQRPRVTAGNTLLWVGPFLILIGGLGVLVLRGRQKKAADAPLSAEEAAELERLTSDFDNVRNP